jgi:ParB-like chromosome segregation protein Spo0J
MNTITVKISEVKNNPNNPRVIKDDKFEKLVNSIKEFPKMLEIRPIVVNDDMIVLGGNMRLKACKAAGLKEVPIIKASELTEDEQKQFIIKDNVSGGEWDWEALAVDWNADELEEWGLDVPKFAEAEENESKDLSNELKETFEVIVSCTDEKNQEQVYNKLIGEGLVCRVLTL